MKSFFTVLIASALLVGCGDSMEPLANRHAFAPAAEGNQVSLTESENGDSVAEIGKPLQSNEDLFSEDIRPSRPSTRPDSRPEGRPIALPVAPPSAKPEQEDVKLDPAKLIAPNLISEALAELRKSPEKFPNQDIITIVDFALPSSQKRFFIVSMKTGKVWSSYMAHGSGSGGKEWAKTFSNKWGSHASSLGAFRATNHYVGIHGHAVRLEGLSGAKNSNAMMRGIVIHGAWYVKNKPQVQGRSWGCFVVPNEFRLSVAKIVRGGSLLYAGLGRK